MDRAIKHHFNKDIKETIQLTGGWKGTWLLILSDNQKLIFRAHPDCTTSGGRELIMADKFEREKFFYDNVNKKLGKICPEVYVVDGTHEYYENSYQISEYIEGKELSKCFREDFDEKTKNEISYKIGEISAKINQIEIDPNHPYITSRNSWEEYLATRLYERLIPLVKNEFITLDEVNTICENIRNKKAAHTLSFTHLDMRHCNMIYNNGKIFVLDAENCEFGDPLHELAVIDVAQESNDYLIQGYKSIFKDINLDSILYYFYKLEILGLVLDIHFNEINAPSQFYLNIFNEVKEKVLR
jgi:aminoglycoside phosphotransferase (APT) family kinase protein